MQRSFLAFLILFLGPYIDPLYAGWNWDLSQDALGRSYPIGGVYQVRSGLSHTVWDKREEKNNKILYGMIRGGANFRTSGLINTAEGELAFYPIAFFGVFARSSFSLRRLETLDTFDCDRIDCQGELKRREFGARFALKAGPWFLMNEWRRLRLDPDVEKAIYADEMTTMELSNAINHQDIRLTIFGRELTDKWSIGVLNLYNKLHDEDLHTYKLMLLTQYKMNEWTAAFAAGKFHTRHGDDVLSFVAIWKYNFRSGDMLF